MISVTVAEAGTQGPVGGTIGYTLGVKIYRALLNQTGSSDPVPTVLENSLSGPIVWTRDSTGQYRGTLAGAFPPTKTFISYGAVGGLSNDVFISITNDGSSNVITIQVEEPQVAFRDGYLTNTPIEILVYP